MHTHTPIHIHRYAFTETCIHMHTHTGMHTLTPIHIYRHTCTHIYTKMYIHRHVHTFTHTYTQTCLHTYIYTDMHTHVPSYIHTSHKGKKPKESRGWVDSGMAGLLPILACTTAGPQEYLHGLQWELNGITSIMSWDLTNLNCTHHGHCISFFYQTMLLKIRICFLFPPWVSSPTYKTLRKVSSK